MAFYSIMKLVKHMYKILVVEDDSSIRLGLKYYLEQEDFDVIEADSVESAQNNLSSSIDLILLDINLPDGSGFDLFKDIKKRQDIPIIFLTANDLEVSVVMGLDMGADDYITKPFKARELVSRIKNVLRRTKGKNDSNVIKIHDIVIDMKQAKVFKNGIDVMLTALEYKILLILALNPNTIFSREKILADIWDVNEAFVNDNTLTVYIKRIREKIEDDPNSPKIILTVRGVGYKVGV